MNIEALVEKQLKR